MNHYNVSKVRSYINNGKWHDLIRFLSGYKADSAMTLIFIACRDANTDKTVSEVVAEIALITLIERLPDSEVEEG